jgi:transposase-like protein
MWWLIPLRDMVQYGIKETTMPKRYPPKFKFQVVLELLQGEQSVGQLAKSYGVHPNAILKWKKELLEKGPQVFTKDNSAAYTRSGSPSWNSCWKRKRSSWPF